MKYHDIEITHNNVIPLHEQLTNQIRQLILSRRWQTGYRVPSETELQRHLDISRSTVRHALRTIEIEGLIERVAGRGTFVSPLRERAHRPLAFQVIDFDHPQQRELLRGAEVAAREAGYPVFFCNSDFDPAEERRLLEQLKHDDVAGVLLWMSIKNGKSDFITRLCEPDFPPVAMMDRTFGDFPCDYVASDSYAGTYRTIEHLIELGHERIAFLSCGILDLMPIAERYRAYREAMIHAGLKPMDAWVFGEPDQEIYSEMALRAFSENDDSSVGEVADLLKDRFDDATAIVAINDNVALLTLKAAQRLGISIPDDLSLTGFDDVDLVSYLPTPMTTVAQDYFAMGKAAAELVIERIEGCYSGPPRKVLLPTQLRARATTSVPRHVKQRLSD
ncbi:MAG: GntR family transcriptional regulator [Anaerolineae bacterium]|nr:GntR family transcriptional regulator [Anaerolineae bacterium]